MIPDNTIFYNWFSFIFRFIALLILYVFVTLSGVTTLDKYRKFKRDEGVEKPGKKYLGLPVSIIIVNSILLAILGILIVYPTSFSQETYAIYELVSGSVLCILFVWLVIDIAYHKPEDKSIVLLISNFGFLFLLISLLLSQGIILIFITLFVFYINLELHGATGWIIYDEKPEKTTRIILTSLISFIMVPILLILSSSFPDPAVQAGLGCSAICHALTVVYISEFLSEEKLLITWVGLFSFISTIFISIIIPNPISGSFAYLLQESINSAFIVAIIIDGICLTYLLNILISRILDWKKDNRLKSLIVSGIITIGFWILFSISISVYTASTGLIIPFQSNFLILITLSPPILLLFMIAISQTFILFVLTSIAAYDLQWVKDFIKWIGRQEKYFVDLGFVFFGLLVTLLIIGIVWTSVWSTIPYMWTLIGIFWVGGLICLFASFYGHDEGFLYLIFCYIGLGLTYAIIFAPMALGILGLIGLVAIIGILLGMAIDSIENIEYILPFVIAIISMILGLTLMNIRLANQITNPDTANLAGIFEWFFGLLFATNAIVTSFYLSDERDTKMIYVFIAGLIMISITHLILFTWDTRLSMALSYCWIASAVALILPSLFVLFKSQWDALHEDKWSSVITSILSAIIIMIASGTKFTPGLTDLANSIISIGLAISLVVGYYIYSKKKIKGKKPSIDEEKVPELS